MLTFLSMEVSPSEAVMPWGAEITSPSAFTHSRTGSVHPYVTYAISVVPPRVSVVVRAVDLRSAQQYRQAQSVHVAVVLRPLHDGCENAEAEG